ncbi:MAG: hypothetical protein GC204_03705 [Chloroflexi bacterium]|nr:hypothetical protein [Chloroflexota bacterium]
MYTLINANIGALLDKIDAAAYVQPYLNLRAGWADRDIAQDSGFQQTYRRFWRMNAARLSPTFLASYFDLLTATRDSGAADVAKISRALYAIPCNGAGDRKLHFSFAAKLAHMVDPDLPIYDSLIARFYFLDGVDEGDFKARLSARLADYGFLQQEYARILHHNLLQPAIEAFRDRFPAATDVMMSDQKVIDTLIWRFTAWLNSGALRNGALQY